MTIPRNDTLAAEPSTKKTVEIACFHKLFDRNKDNMEVRDMESPKYGDKAFVCPHCSSYAQQEWHFIVTMSRPIPNGYASEDYVEYYELTSASDPFIEVKIAFSDCKVCSESAVWVKGKLIHPNKRIIEKPHELMPKEVKEIYDEAAAVYDISPRSSAALLRLGLEILLPYLGADKAKINTMIQQLVEERKAIGRVQKAMDALRVIGNDAVHPGVIDLEGRDDKEVSLALFKITNYIVAETLGSDDMIEDLYSLLPGRVKEGIENRKIPNKTK